LKKLTVDLVSHALVSLGYKEKGGSEFFRVLADPKDGQNIKVFYIDYDHPNDIVIHEA
jgi:hypothetical protein